MIVRAPSAFACCSCFSKVGHVAVGVAVALRLAQAHAVDDRGVVERVGDDRVLFAQQRFEQATVGVEAGGVEDGVLGAEEVGDGLFQLLVQVLGAADEAYRGHAEAVGVERVLGGGDDVRVVGQAQVVVGAEVQHGAAVGEGDLGRLRAGDDALGLEQPLGADGLQFVGIATGECAVVDGVYRGGHDAGVVVVGRGDSVRAAVRLRVRRGGAGIRMRLPDSLCRSRPMGS